MSPSTLHSISFERLQLPFYGPPDFYRFYFSAPWRAGGTYGGTYGGATSTFRDIDALATPQR